MADLAIEVKGLRKSYGGLEAVRGIDLSVQRGQVFALLGPNGAGKTTTVEILEGHRRRTSGEVSVLGFDPARRQRAFRDRIGIVLQDTGVNRFLTVAEAIDQFRGFYPNPLPLDEIIAIVELQEKRDVLVRKLSGGQQRRIDVAAGLAGNPELLFLDEPTTGFDPSARRNAWKMIGNLKDLGKTILLTTHYMDEAQHLADHVAIIVGGLVVSEGPPHALGSLAQSQTKITFILHPEHALPPEMASGAVRDGASVEITTAEPVRTLNELTRWALADDVDLTGLSVNQASLEDIYLEVTDRESSR